MEVCQSERLIIEYFNVNDCEFILTLFNQHSVIENIGDRGLRQYSDALSYIQNNLIPPYNDYGYGMFKVTLRNSNIPIGMCGFVKRANFPMPDLGFAFLENSSSQGYATEASKAALLWINDNTDITTVLSITAQNNMKANRLLKRLGFNMTDEVDLYGRKSNVYEYRLDNQTDSKKSNIIY